MALEKITSFQKPAFAQRAPPAHNGALINELNSTKSLKPNTQKHHYPSSLCRRKPDNYNYDAVQPTVIRFDDLSPMNKLSKNFDVLFHAYSRMCEIRYATRRVFFPSLSRRLFTSYGIIASSTSTLVLKEVSHYANSLDRRTRPTTYLHPSPRKQELHVDELFPYEPNGVHIICPLG